MVHTTQCRDAMAVTEHLNGIRGAVQNNDKLATAEHWFRTALTEAGNGKWALIGAKIVGLSVFLALSTLLIGFTNVARAFLLIGLYIGFLTVLVHAVYALFLFVRDAQDSIQIHVNLDVNIERIEKND